MSKELPVYCRKCHRLLDSTNWYSSRQKYNDKICISCHYLEKSENQRIHRLHTTINGEDVYLFNVQKRPKLAFCELCRRKVERLHYHHWIPECPSIGIWLCWFCHGFAERIEEDLLDRYLELKIRIEKEYLEV